MNPHGTTPPAPEDAIREFLALPACRAVGNEYALAALASLVAAKEAADTKVDALAEALREKYEVATLTCSRLRDSAEDDPDGSLLDYYEGRREAFKEAAALAALSEPVEASL